MTYMVAASVGFQHAREIYEAGYKSANKAHLKPTSLFADGELLDDVEMDFDDEDGQVDPAYGHRLNGARIELTIERTLMPTNIGFLRHGKAMLRTRPAAANCGELAIMAAAAAWGRLGERQNAPLALVSLRAPADHVFCVVGPRDWCRELRNYTIEDLVLFPSNANLWVADPWLNVMCRLPHYPAQAAAKFNKWQRANKRIAWDGPQGLGWYPPAGDYSAGFDAAGLTVRLA